MAKLLKKEMAQLMLQAIDKYKICFFDHTFAYVPFSRSSAYAKNLDKMDAIKEAIMKNRVSGKSYMLNKWIKGNNSTLQISAYRLLSDSDEHRKLNQSYIDHESKGEKMDFAPVINITRVQKNDDDN